MQDSFRMCRRQPRRQLHRQGDQLFFWNRTVEQSFIERDARYQFANKEVVSVDSLEVVNDLDGRVIQAGENLRFVAEPSPGIFVIQDARCQNLDGEVALEFLVACPVHDTHPTRTDLCDDAIAAERLTDSKGQACTPRFAKLSVRTRTCN